MRRFNYDENDEHRREIDNFFGGEGDNSDFSSDDYKMDDDKTVFELQVDLAIQELNHKVLRTAIRIAENSFWWKFYSLETRLKKIHRIYKRLRKFED